MNRMNRRFDSINDRFENIILRMILLEKTISLNEDNKRKRQIIGSSEEYGIITICYFQSQS